MRMYRHGAGPERRWRSERRMGAYTSTLFAEESRVWRAVRVAVTFPRVLRAVAGRSTTAGPKATKVRFTLVKKWPAWDSVLSVFLVYGEIPKWYLIVNVRNEDAISKFAWSIHSPVRYRHFAQSVGASNGWSTLLPAIVRGQYNITFRVEGKERLREIVRHAISSVGIHFLCSVNLVQGKAKNIFSFSFQVLYLIDYPRICLFVSCLIFDNIYGFFYISQNVCGQSRSLNADLAKCKNLSLIYYLQTFEAIIQTDSPPICTTYTWWYLTRFQASNWVTPQKNGGYRHLTLLGRKVFKYGPAPPPLPPSPRPT